MKNRSENSAGRGQIWSILQVNSHSIDQKSGQIWTGQTDLQPISFKSDRLLGASVLLSLAVHVAVLQLLPGIQNKLPTVPVPEIMQVRLMPVHTQPAPSITPQVTDAMPRKTVQPRTHQIPPDVRIRSSSTPAVVSVPVPASEPPQSIQTTTETAPAAVLSSQKIAESEQVTIPDYRAAYLDNPRPAYPLAARRRGLEGKVVLRVEVLENGSCNRLAIKDSSGHDILDQAAMQAVKAWRFIPARRGDEAIKAWVEIPISYHLAG